MNLEANATITGVGQGAIRSSIKSNIESTIEANQSFSDLLGKVQTIGREVLSRHAAEVDRAARFPQEAIEALRKAKLLSAYVPQTYGGRGLNLQQIAKICETLGRYCGSSAMIYAMHQIQVACVVHHAQQSPYFQKYLRRLVREERLIASATTEVGTGGDLRSSICALETNGNAFRLSKKAPVISYGEHADDLMITCRRAEDAPAGEQVFVMVNRQTCSLEPLSGWDTLGFRGTCSSGFTLQTEGHTEQIFPVPFSVILAQTMHPVSHIVWSSLWTGIATEAVNIARAFVRAEARKTPGETPLSALRLAEVDGVLQEMRNNVLNLTQEYQQLRWQEKSDAFDNFGFAIRTNNLKLSSSQLIVEVVSRALMICGIAGYRNDSQYSLARLLRDAYGAALMVNNDRILKLNATMLMVHKES
ncbi:MAG: acyl-CoA/acyl-ACP dehydrogenase [Acidobacteria bacterium]|nr:acyl-CoA/acyl-ACP dehydrogenase [Acidobacteriota bacterium]